MNNGYDYEPQTGSGLIFRLREKGQTARIRLASWPLVYDDTFKDGSTTKRMAWAAILKTQGEGGIVREAKVFVAGTMVYNAIRALSRDEDWGDPSTFDVEIARTEKEGAYYTVTPKPAPRGPLSADEAALFAEHGYDPKSGDWAFPWIEKVLKIDTNGGGGREEYDPFQDE